MIQKRLVDKLALAMLEGKFGEGDTVVVDVADGDLVFEKAGSLRREQRVPVRHSDLVRASLASWASDPAMLPPAAASDRSWRAASSTELRGGSRGPRS